ncbi:MAG: aminoacyl-histidine dipeptidase [Bacteroidales bacterium]|nr:aminoacyl-histidine dipeptidase [Bacteroidales bacterium]
MTIAKLNPERVWKNFYALTQVPRPSKKEGKIIAFMEKWGKDHGIETYKDEIGNIIMRKPATKGMENRKGILLQGHLDMVPQKNNDKVHNFEKDPIETKVVKIDGEDWVCANGTTLGADNGLGVAIAMAVLEAKDLVHGPIEALFTIDEETGMTGAFGLKPGLLKSDILINLDSEAEGELYVGCAGGLDGNVELKYKEEPLPKGFAAYQITVKGLCGGHSGMEINLGRGNANKIMARTLLPVLRDLKAKLVSIEGGTLRNAIPRECVAVIAIPKENVAKMKECVKTTFTAVKNEIGSVDGGLQILVDETKAKSVMKGNVGLKFVKALCCCPNGVERMSADVEGLVETSNNLAVVKSEKGLLTVRCLMRSSVDTAKFALSQDFACAFELAGAKVYFTGAYSGWKPNMNSAILKEMKDIYKKMYKKEPAIMAIHAGLECGVLGSKYPNLDMVSCGPTLKSPHSPDERAHVASVAKVWDFIVEVLKNAPKK